MGIFRLIVDDEVVNEEELGQLDEFFKAVVTLKIESAILDKDVFGKLCECKFENDVVIKDILFQKVEEDGVTVVEMICSRDNIEA